MATSRELIPYASGLSLLYIDEHQEFLMSAVEILKQSFFRVDDAHNATAGISFAKLNSYDIIIVDSSSSIMNVMQLVENIKHINKYQTIIVSIENMSDSEIVELYKLDVAIIQKPFSLSVLLDELLDICSKKIHEREYLKDKVDTLSEDIAYERKRIGRFMVNEKKLSNKIKLYESSIHINKNVYDLTKLPSRYALNTALTGEPQSLLYLNIDNFDFINTVYGMGKGNDILKKCAIRLNQFLPQNAELFHIMADEFVILLDEPSHKQDILLADQIHALFKEAPIEFDEYTHYLVFSIGIDEGKGKILFLNAKSASKEARYFGGDKTVFYSHDSAYMRKQRENLYWIGKLNKAFEEDELLTYYQPILNIKNPEIKHYEVLCRLKDSDGELIDAKNFIESAKLSGLITRITKTVIDKTFKEFQYNDYNFSINISMYDLYENYLLNFLAYKCKHYNIDPSRVYLEIVEDVISSKASNIDNQVIELKNSGYQVVIDDFGSEQSTFSRMFDLQVKIIKIDGSFIKELSRNDSYRKMVQSIVDFAKNSGIKTMAEHVESEEIHQIVKEIGIDYSQGYLFGKPSLEL